MGSSKQQNTSLYTITAANTEVIRVGQGVGAYNASDKCPVRYRVWLQETILYAQLYCKQTYTVLSMKWNIVS